MPRKRRAPLLAAILSLLVTVGAGDLDPPAGAPPEQQQQQQAPAPPQQEQQQQQPPPAPVQAPAREQAPAPPKADVQAPAPGDGAPVAPPVAAPAADGVAPPLPTDAAAPAIPVVPVVVPPTDAPLSPRQAVEINDSIVQKAAALAMVDVDPVSGKAIGWRVVRADKQSVAAGTNYYLQIEMRTKTRCEVHEKRVLVKAKTGNFIVGGLGDLLPCDPPPADYMTKGKKGLRKGVGPGEE